MYDNPREVTYTFKALAFGGSGSTAKLPIPRSVRQARVLDILAIVSVTFTQVTTPALIQVGDGTTANKFAELNMGGTTNGNSVTGADMPAPGVWKSNYGAQNYNSGAGLHDFTATFVAATGGSPAGTADVYIIIAYDQIQPV